MDDLTTLKGNSHKSKEALPEKKVEKVITGEARTKRKLNSKKWLTHFLWKTEARPGITS